ncbi:hypothetical protein [Micromonospora sp. NPDC000018]|uniref:hypothetical protein n=1 Tax=Micromonospora sp. NPDC000018 TaxID=3154239 RepID=UPI00333443C0
MRTRASARFASAGASSDTHPRRRTGNRPRAGATALAAAGALGFTLLASGVASAAAASAIPAPPPRLVGGNITTCEEAGLDGEIILQSTTGQSASNAAGTGTVSADGLTLDVTINAGFTATGIAVKGGPNANVYTGPFVGPILVEDMEAPTNPGEQQPQISHWFVCGFERQPTTPPTKPPKTELPKTGSSLNDPSVMLPVAFGSGLLLLGATLVVLHRRRDGEARG